MKNNQHNQELKVKTLNNQNICFGQKIDQQQYFTIKWDSNYEVLDGQNREIRSNLHHQPKYNRQKSQRINQQHLHGQPIFHDPIVRENLMHSHGLVDRNLTHYPNPDPVLFPSLGFQHHQTAEQRQQKLPNSYFQQQKQQICKGKDRQKSRQKKGYFVRPSNQSKHCVKNDQNEGQGSHLKQKQINVSMNPQGSQTNAKIQSASQAQPQQTIKLHIRSQLIRKSRKYQISTNNAHKKYINCLKNLFYQALSEDQIKEFETRFIKLKNNRVFFFIILVYVKFRFTTELAQAVKLGFVKQMYLRIKQYQQQIRLCSDYMLKNYRYEEIHEIQIALKAIEQFYQNNTSEAVEYLYRKDKHIIVKQNHFRTSLKFIKELQIQFDQNHGERISKPYKKEHYHRSRFHGEREDKLKYFSKEMQKQVSSIKQVVEYKQLVKQVKQNVLTNNPNLRQVYAEQFAQAQNQTGVPQSIGNKSQNRPKRPQQLSKNITPQLHQNQDQQHLKQVFHGLDQLQGKSLSQQLGQYRDNSLTSKAQWQQDNLSIKGKQEEIVSKGQSQMDLISYRQNQPNLRQASTYNFRPNNQQSNVQNDNDNQFSYEEILYPPIPPFFYLPQFDEKYGYFLRNAIYIKKWKQLNRKMHTTNQNHQGNNRSMQYNDRRSQHDPNPTNTQAPAALRFADPSMFYQGKL